MIDKNSGVSYYRQLMDHIKKQIVSEIYKPGDRLPSEKELVAIFQVNRHTVRQALGELAYNGLIYSERGKGTFVASNKPDMIDYKVSRRTSFTHNIMEVGLIPNTQVLQGEEVAAVERVARNLGLETGARVVLLEILRFINHEAFCVSTNFFPSHLVPGLLARVDEILSLYEFLDRYYELRPVRTYSTFQAAFPDSSDVAALDIPRNQPVLIVESAMTGEDGTAIQYSITRFRGDRGKISVGFD